MFSRDGSKSLNFNSWFPATDHQSKNVSPAPIPRLPIIARRVAFARMSTNSSPGSAPAENRKLSVIIFLMTVTASPFGAPSTPSESRAPACRTGGNASNLHP
jgi:hypothetical protein